MSEFTTVKVHKSLNRKLLIYKYENELNSIEEAIRELMRIARKDDNTNE
jgi:hypothetical protein|tara:strand:- start:54 stop:200 length:147 start_codon:yes stop_codon:yes gene_type:complete